MRMLPQLPQKESYMIHLIRPPRYESRWQWYVSLHVAELLSLQFYAV
jgi:hypothetical protein